MATKDLKTETSRVLAGVRDSLKALIVKLGGSVPDGTLLDAYPAIVTQLALNLAAKAHASTHKTGGSDALAPADIGAAAASHNHTKSQITDFPTSMTPTAHKASHKTGGSDAIAPADIGAAAASHNHTKSQITDFPSSMTPTAHKATHKTGGSDAIAPADIGAAAASHTHTKSQITDFPSSMTPAAHKATHKTGGSDAIAPADIGAAAASHTHDYLPLSGGTLTGNLNGKYLTGTWLQTTDVTDKTGNIATIDADGWIYYRTPAEVLSDIGAAAASHSHAAGDITSGTLPIARGGTGATTATAARSALGAQATVKKRTGSLTVAGWSSKTQTISVTSVSASNCVIVAPDPSSLAAYAAAGVKCTAQASGTLTFACESVPAVALTVNVAIL